MVFRKDALLYAQSQAFYFAMPLLSLALIPIVGLGVSCLCGLPFLLLLPINPVLHNEFITMDENGVSCQKAGKEIWGYRWDEIAELRRGSRFSLPSIEMIAYSRNGTPEPFAAPDHYFQLSKAARAAVSKYYRAKCDE